MALLNVTETMERFNISKPTVLRAFACKGSPAFKIGEGNGHWRVDEEKLEQFLIKRSEKYKG